MTYSQALDYIHNTLKFGSKPGLGRIQKLLEYMGNPQDSLSFIHVAGTNGKGSTCTAISYALTQAGYRTGLYISPFIEEFCERIQINACKISHEQFIQAVEFIRPFVKRVADEYEHPTEFEIITALAFYFFKSSKCDAVVLEVGLGGRFDATNIIKSPLVSVITSISYDHTEILGDTLTEIAFEKCGIIKKGSVVVSSPNQDPEALAVIMQTCAENGNTLVMPNLKGARIIKENLFGTDILYKDQQIHIPLGGRHQISNFLTALETVTVLRERLGWSVADHNIASGFASVRFPARLEVLNKKPLIILDGAHNVDGAKTLAQFIDTYLQAKKIVVVMGMLSDKDYENAIALIAPFADVFIAVRPDSPRALEPEFTAKAASKYCSRVIACSDYKDAITLALNEVPSDGTVIVCGSLYLAGPMRKIILGKNRIEINR